MGDIINLVEILQEKERQKKLQEVIIHKRFSVAKHEESGRTGADLHQIFNFSLAPSVDGIR